MCDINIILKNYLVNLKNNKKLLILENILLLNKKFFKKRLNYF